MITFTILTGKNRETFEFEGTPTRQRELVQFALRTMAINAASVARFDGRDQTAAVVAKMTEYGLKRKEGA